MQEKGVIAVSVGSDGGRREGGGRKGKEEGGKEGGRNYVEV